MIWKRQMDRLNFPNEIRCGNCAGLGELFMARIYVFTYINSLTHAFLLKNGNWKNGNIFFTIHSIRSPEFWEVHFFLQNHPNRRTIFESANNLLSKIQTSPYQNYAIFLKPKRISIGRLAWLAHVASIGSINALPTQ